MQLLSLVYQLILIPFLPLQLLITGYELSSKPTTTHAISRYQIIITEIMADPSPPVALPEYEYIELKNVSGKSIDLRGFKLGDETGLASFTSNVILPPDSFIICCSNTAAAQLKLFGRCIGLSNFPSLANESDLVQLISPEGNIVHAVQYHSDWYNNNVKAAGGWSLEMINTALPCIDAGNWTASNSPEGGTPGRENIQFGGSPDSKPPSLVHSYAVTNNKLIAVFNEPLDSASAAQVKNYTLTPGNHSFKSSLALSPVFKSVQLELSEGIDTHAVYKLEVNNVKDCAGNFSGAMSVKTGLPAPPSEGDIIINEILFDPSREGADYIELHNRSAKIIDLQALYCSNRNNSNQIANTKQLSNTAFMIYPGDYILLTENPGWVQQQFSVKNLLALRKISIPAMPNEQGSIVITDIAGTIIDELRYAANWHFPLLSSTENISLERIDPFLSTQNRHNWSSASGAAGGGTPGYLNSQFKPAAESAEQFQLSAGIFSPDMDGRDDILLIRFQTSSPGTMGTVRVFDIAGKPVRQLISNGLMGTTGQWSWDGLGENKLPLPSGIYIIQVSWFNQSGGTGRWKKPVALVRRH